MSVIPRKLVSAQGAPRYYHSKSQCYSKKTTRSKVTTRSTFSTEGSLGLVPWVGLSPHGLYSQKDQRRQNNDKNSF